jgi:hypothetical protein
MPRLFLLCNCARRGGSRRERHIVSLMAVSFKQVQMAESEILGEPVS